MILKLSSQQNEVFIRSPFRIDCEVKDSSQRDKLFIRSPFDVDFEGFLSVKLKDRSLNELNDDRPHFRLPLMPTTTTAMA